MRTLANKRRKAGVMAVEFALAAPVFTLLLVVVADLSMAYHRLMQLSSTLAAGAQYAFAQGQTESGSTLTTDVSAFVSAVTPITLASVTVKYNNSLSATSCYCVNGSPPTYSSAMTCGATCTDGSGSTAGKFVSIAGSFNYTAVFPGDQVFFSNPYTQTVTVRLQ